MLVTGLVSGAWAAILAAWIGERRSHQPRLVHRHRW
jgi:hypothetical protein